MRYGGPNLHALYITSHPNFFRYLKDACYGLKFLASHGIALDDVSLRNIVVDIRNKKTRFIDLEIQEALTDPINCMDHMSNLLMLDLKFNAPNLWSRLLQRGSIHRGKDLIDRILSLDNL
jgi:serine/threonine protein kinase